MSEVADNTNIDDEGYFELDDNTTEDKSLSKDVGLTDMGEVKLEELTKVKSGVKPEIGLDMIKEEWNKDQNEADSTDINNLHNQVEEEEEDMLNMDYYQARVALRISVENTIGTAVACSF